MEKRTLTTKSGDNAGVLNIFREICAEQGLIITLDSTLATIPGSRHLHLRPATETKGVLEFTLDLRDGSSWLSWHSNRVQPWVPVVAEKLAIRFHERIAS